MPIRPENRARYPKDWTRISRFIRFDRAGGRCECIGECGVGHVPRRCIERDGQAAVFADGKVVLTVAHLDHTPENCDEDNLRAMCQRCHNAYDAPTRRAGRVERLRIARGEQLLFPAETSSSTKMARKR